MSKRHASSRHARWQLSVPGWFIFIFDSDASEECAEPERTNRSESDHVLRRRHGPEQSATQRPKKGKVRNAGGGRHTPGAPARRLIRTVGTVFIAILAFLVATAITVMLNHHLGLPLEYAAVLLAMLLESFSIVR